MQQLPGKLGEIAASIGAPCAIRLPERWGGTRIYVVSPPGPSADHQIVAVIGLARARRLSRDFGPNWLEIPTNAAGQRAERNRAMLEEHRKGAMVRELARRHGMTARHVYQIIRNARHQGES